ncbi:hypothetical protein KI688_012422 [Linnemannia hyalina]|uniref:CCHC-type domain-containing protein n=1 Tax=Linnemannia hyalina TaxID=64524 RepID=A0A9P7XV09_9FUNG|nr:hypothetical protein KI688_012422 [Linnemannia hyalina]
MTPIPLQILMMNKKNNKTKNNMKKKNHYCRQGVNAGGPAIERSYNSGRRPSPLSNNILVIYAGASNWYNSKNKMANPTFYLTNLETWTNAQDMDVESWLADVYQVADITQLPYQRVVKLKTTGMAKGWVERWALEFATDGSKEKFSTDFRAEIARPRTTASTYAEIMSIKQKTGELTDRYIARMKANIKLLQLTSKPDATLYTLTDDAEATFSIAFCRGLMPGHPFKVKNRDPEPTLAGTYAALAKYCRHNQYEEETYEDKIRKEAERLAPRHTTGSIEIAGTKIPAAEFQAFRKDFEPETLTAEVDEMVKMFESWSLASLEDQTSAGRVARTIARLPVAVARKVFGHTRFAQHIRGGAIEMPASRQVVQPSATPASTGPRLCHKCQAEGHYANECPAVECYHCHERGHVARVCPNKSTTPATGPNSIPVTQQNSMRVQSIEIDHALAAQRTTRSMGGVDQKRRQERSNLPVGPKAKKDMSPAKSKVVDRAMDWEEEPVSGTLNDAAGIGHIESSDRGRRGPVGVVTIEPVTEEAIGEDAVRKRRPKQKVEPDPVFVSSIENLTFDVATISKHGGRMPSQLKAAVSRVYGGLSSPNYHMVFVTSLQILTISTASIRGECIYDTKHIRQPL